MPNTLELDGGISYEFDPNAVFEKDGKTFNFVSLKKISTYTDRGGKEQKKYQNLTVKIAHKLEFIPWLEECIEELKGDTQAGDDVPF